MKLEIIKILACPICSGFPLTLDISDRDGEEVINGKLSCSSCNTEYTIQDKIPRMIPKKNQIRKDTNIKPDDFRIKDTINDHFHIEQANITYYDVAANTYDQDVAQSLHQNKFNQKRIEAIIGGLFNDTKGKWFLDVGCGTGNVLKFGTKYFEHAVGVEVSLNMLKKANERGMQVVQADALFLPFAADTFDVVSIFSVLHHIYDYLEFFPGVFRVLKKNGYLYTDWDPVKLPTIKINKKKVSGQIYSVLSFLYRHAILLKTKYMSEGKGKINKYPNLRDSKPDIQQIYKMAEYHEQKANGERGLDIDNLERSLATQGFTDIHPTFHWAGRSFNQLNIIEKIRIILLSDQSGVSRDQWMENVQIICRKG